MWPGISVIEVAMVESCNPIMDFNQTVVDCDLADYSQSYSPRKNVLWILLGLPNISYF